MPPWLANGRLSLSSVEERQLLADTWAVGQVSIDERVGDATQVSRVLVALKRPSSYTVRPQGQVDGACQPQFVQGFLRA